MGTYWINPDTSPAGRVGASCLTQHHALCILFWSHQGLAQHCFKIQLREIKQSISVPSKLLKRKKPPYANENIKQKSLLNPLELDRGYNTAGPHSCTGCFPPSTPGFPGLLQHTDPKCQHRSLQNPSQITSCH